MTFEEACKIIDFEKTPEGYDETSQRTLIKTVSDFTKDGAETIDPRDAHRIRAEFEMFG